MPTEETILLPRYSGWINGPKSLGRNKDMAVKNHTPSSGTEQRSTNGDQAANGNCGVVKKMARLLVGGTANKGRQRLTRLPTEQPCNPSQNQEEGTWTVKEKRKGKNV